MAPITESAADLGAYADWFQDPETDGANYWRTGDVRALSAMDLADFCEQAFQELDTECPAVGTFERYQEIVEELERRHRAVQQPRILL